MTIHAAQRKQETKLFFETLKTVGANIKAKRTANGWTTRQFAPLIGLTQSSVTWIESGRKRIPLTWVVSAAEALGVPVHLLFVPNSFSAPKAPKLRGR